MSEQAAELALYAIVSVEAAVWLAGAWFLWSSSKVRPTPADDRFELAQPEPAGRLRGRAEVEGRPADLAARAASALAKGEAATLGPVKILGRSDDGVVFEGSGRSAGKRSPGQWIRHGEIRLASAGMERSAVDWTVEISRTRWLLALGRVFLLLGLAALGVGFWLIRTYVVPNADPAVRGQTFQMLQAVHFLWPPFLFGGLYRFQHHAIRAAMDTFVHNLPYRGE